MPEPIYPKDPTIIAIASDPNGGLYMLDSFGRIYFGAFFLGPSERKDQWSVVKIHSKPWELDP